MMMNMAAGGKVSGIFIVILAAFILIPLLYVALIIVLPFTPISFNSNHDRVTAYINSNRQFSLTYPRLWNRREYVSGATSGVYLSPLTIDPKNADFTRGIVDIYTTPISEYIKNSRYQKQTYPTIRAFIDTMRADEDDTGKTNPIPTSPGASSFRVVGKPSIPLPAGFEEVSSLDTALQHTRSEAHMYWYVKNGVLYTFYFQYPLSFLDYPANQNTKEIFDSMVAVIAKSLKIK